MRIPRPHQTLWFTIFLACATPGAHGDTNDIVAISRETTRTNSVTISKVPDVLLKALERQDVFDQITDSLLNGLFDNKQGTNAFLKFINDWHVRPKVFQATSGSNNVSFGVE